MKFRIERRDIFWENRKYKVVQFGKGWKIQRPIDDPEPTKAPDLEKLLNQYFRKRKKWE